MLLRRIARPLLAAWFIGDAVSAVRSPQSHVEVARTPVNKVVTALGKEPLTDSQLRNVVRAEGVVTVFLGLGLASGRAPRACGLLLAATTIPHIIATAPVGPKFDHEGRSRSERVGPFLQKAGAVGAALLVAADTAGKPSMAYRVNKAKTERAQQLLQAQKSATAKVDQAVTKAQKSVAAKVDQIVPKAS